MDTRKRTALLAASLMKPLLPGSHTNFVITHSGKRPALAMDTISASQGCPLTGTSTVVVFSLTDGRSKLLTCDIVLCGLSVGIQVLNAAQLSRDKDL